jgi:hypothetical protein
MVLIIRQPNVPVQRRRYAVRWNRLLADRFFIALSYQVQDWAGIKPGINPAPTALSHGSSV